ncbi:MAG TPA: metallophosphoesterase [Candidatus Polarisedimenticolia bacterium]|nr:metallophosphoesterase [Candidatus Polarisedimenticolia bacterium]
MTDRRPLFYVADAHLTRDDPEVDAFVAFLEREAPSAGTLCIVGDLFNVWFGEPKFTMPHQARVLDSLRRLAAGGVRLTFVEGNRDFSIRRHHLGAPFDEVAEGCLVDLHAGRRILATHGDEVNRRDRQYLLWKRVSKSGLVYGSFRLLPGRWGVQAGERLERRLSGTNLRHKARFPEQECRRFASELLGPVCDAIVLGHFHEERQMALPGGTVHVLPAWRGTHRYLSFDGPGPPRFVTFNG